MSKSHYSNIMELFSADVLSRLKTKSVLVDNFGSDFNIALNFTRMPYGMSVE